MRVRSCVRDREHFSGFNWRFERQAPKSNSPSGCFSQPQVANDQRRCSCHGDDADCCCVCVSFLCRLAINRPSCPSLRRIRPSVALLPWVQVRAARAAQLARIFAWNTNRSVGAMRVCCASKQAGKIGSKNTGEFAGRSDIFAVPKAVRSAARDKSFGRQILSSRVRCFFASKRSRSPANKGDSRASA